MLSRWRIGMRLKSLGSIADHFACSGDEWPPACYRLHRSDAAAVLNERLCRTEGARAFVPLIVICHRSMHRHELFILRKLNPIQSLFNQLDLLFMTECRIRGVAQICRALSISPRYVRWDALFFHSRLDELHPISNYLYQNVFIC